MTIQQPHNPHRQNRQGHRYGDADQDGLGAEREQAEGKTEKGWKTGGKKQADGRAAPLARCAASVIERACRFRPCRFPMPTRHFQFPDWLRVDLSLNL
jgi:hypothetical protein